MTDPFNPDQPMQPEYEPGRGDPSPTSPDVTTPPSPEEMPDLTPRD